MKELFRRFANSPWISLELVLASLFANMLALASPLFVIQVLNRYVSYGVDSTLATLSFGVVGAILLEFIFRQARLLVISEHLGVDDENRAVGAFGILVTAKRQALDKIPAGQRREILKGLDSVESAYNAANIGSILDVPFAFFFVLALSLLHPVLGGIALFFIVVVIFYSVLNRRALKGPSMQLSETAITGNSLTTTSDRAADAIRAFNGADLLISAWRTYVGKARVLRRKVGHSQGRGQAVTQTVQALMGVAVISIGAILVVGGNLDVGTLIGANILAARALGPVTKLAQLSEELAKAAHALSQIRGLAQLPVERDEGTALSEYRGGVSLTDVAFGFSEMSGPLFENLNLTISAGSVLVVTGGNGTGKTTLARLLAGLLDPVRGQILVDGVELRQVVPSWWRRQIMYLPQEPVFLNGTFRDNLLANNPDLDEDELNRIIRVTDLGRFIDESPNGLETEIVQNGSTLAVGIRRRLALARALTSDGMLGIFDEPTEALDEAGSAAVYAVMKELSERGRTMIISTSDQAILRGARLVLDLNVKPVPRLLTVPVSNDQRSDAGPPIKRRNPEDTR